MVHCLVLFYNRDALTLHLKDMPPPKRPTDVFIGNILVKAVKPGPRPYEIRDGRLPGFLLRVQPSGTLIYVCQYGRGKRLTIGPTSKLTPTQARDKAREILASVELGADPQAERKARKTHTFETFIRDDYGPWFQSPRRTGGMTVHYLLSRFPELKTKRLADINAWLVEKWRAQRLKQVKPATANRELVTLKAALSKAVEWGLLEMHPLVKVKPSKVDHVGRVRFLAMNEEQRLREALEAREERYRQERDQANAWRGQRDYPLLPDLRAAPFVDHLKPLVLLSLNTGLRRGELFNLERSHVDLGRSNLTVAGDTQGNKTAKARHIPLNAEARSVLVEWITHYQPTGLLFPGRYGGRLDNINHGWERLRQEAQLDNFRWHDLRHTFASKLVMAGVDLNTVRELLGHTGLDMTLRYAHLAPEHKAAAVAKLDRLEIQTTITPLASGDLVF